MSEFIHAALIVCTGGFVAIASCIGTLYLDFLIHITLEEQKMIYGDNCKYAEISQGDMVPYGSTSVRLPDTFECMHPDAEEFFENDCVGCPFYDEVEMPEPDYD